MGMMSEEAFMAEAQAIDRRERPRKKFGPICARCNHSPPDESDLPPSPLDFPPDASVGGLSIRTFVCKQGHRHEPADGGRGCRYFDARISAWIG